MTTKSKCVLCDGAIEPGTRTVSVAGGLFPREDPDFFAMDEGVLAECYAHLECFLAAATALASKQAN